MISWGNTLYGQTYWTRNEMGSEGTGWGAGEGEVLAGPQAEVAGPVVGAATEISRCLGFHVTTKCVSVRRLLSPRRSGNIR
jgi:hypothetical protein